MGLFKGIGKALGGIGKAISGIGQALGSITNMVGGLLNSPLGKMLGMVFPPLSMATAFTSTLGMFANLAQQIGGNESY